QYGFDTVGIARPDSIPQAAERLRHFLAEGAHGDMDWMETTAVRRERPGALWPQVRSIIMLGLNYGDGPDSDPLAILRRRDRGGPRGGAARPRRGRGLGYRPGGHPPRVTKAPPQGTGQLADRASRRRREGFRRHRGGDGEAARRRRRPRLAGQAHELGLAPIRLVAVPPRDLHHARSPAGPPGNSSPP